MAGAPTAPGAMPAAAPAPRAPKPEGPISYADEDEELLFGPTARPQDSMAWAGRSPVPRRPRNLERYLGKLTEAARQPDAPKELLDFMRVLSYHIGSGE